MPWTAAIVSAAAAYMAQVQAGRRVPDAGTQLRATVRAIRAVRAGSGMSEERTMVRVEWRDGRPFAVDDEGAWYPVMRKPGDGL